ncbi:DUF1826 domain-containing protein [Vibrio rhizosphaerae]|uniref:DUF1826 domain-containing protein n=1 Tax=Vibrio rhizosphaerae TaxID=398736 RepID=UPI00057032A0|nr:DUF1826 domain-containing protein [Vibrio rhizosphaerae]
MNASLAVTPHSCSVGRILASVGTEPSILTDIYQPENNIAVWQRTLSAELKLGIQEMLRARDSLTVVKTVTPDNAAVLLRSQLEPFCCADALSQDIALIVDMFCCLFDMEAAGLRLTILDRPMCPKFHVDQIPCRLVTTYVGEATEWLKNDSVDRSKLGAGSLGQPDHLSGLFQSSSEIQQLGVGDVALLKGGGWEGNEHRGVIHRSPEVAPNERRLLLTLDMVPRQ